jgi:carbon storage regulator
MAAAHGRMGGRNAAQRTTPRAAAFQGGNDTMLVLNRRPGELIRIGKDITIAVVKISGDVVRLGIEAPREVNVVRTELEGRDKERIKHGD